MRKLNPLHSDDSIAAIFEIATAYQKSKILLTACELDIFSTLGDEEKTSKEVSIETDTDERAVDRLMNALCTLKLLEKIGDRFANTKGTLRFLVKGKPEYIGNMMHLSNLWDKWDMLTDSVRLGKAPDYQSIDEKDDSWVESFVESMHWRGRMQAPDIIKLIKFDNAKKVLDLGAGSGLYSIDMVKAHPHLEVYAYDLPQVIKFAKKHVEAEGAASHIHFLEGDFMKDDIGSDYDMVFLSSVLPMYSIWDNIKLLQKVYDALNKGGQLVIQNLIISDNRTKPEDAALQAINMLVNTMGGDALTETDLWICLKEAWFKNFKRYDTEFGHSLIFARK